MAITIGIPFLNAAATLTQAIRSVFAQSEQDWELILVDDGSTDSSLSIARSIRDPRVTVVSDGVNRGLVARLNEIVQRASRPLVCRMDADDLMHPERLRRQQALLESRPEIDVVGTFAYQMDSAGRPYGLRRVVPSASAVDVLRRGQFIHPSIMGRRAWFQRNPYDAAYVRAEDLELWVRTVEQGRFAVLQEPLLFYREADEFRLSAYLKSARTVRKIIRDYGPRHIGYIQSGTLLAQSLGKEQIFRAAVAVGKANALVQRRGRGLDAQAQADASAALARIEATPLPGLDVGPSL